MKNYSITFKYSKDGKSWYRLNKIVKAESDRGAIEQIKSLYPYVTEINIMSVR